MMDADISGDLRLARGVYYEKYGDAVYLRSVDEKRDYLFNETVYDLLNCFSKKEWRSARSAVERMLELYDVADVGAFRQDMEGFLLRLADSGILERRGAEAEEEPPRVSELVERRCSEERRLYSLGLELTYRCNERCVHCYVDDGPAAGEELSTEQWRALLDEARSMGCVNVLLTGGEVCCRPDFLDIAEYAASIGILVDIYSNGIGIDDSMFERLCAMKINSLSFSLYGGHAHVHDAITGIRGSFDRTLRMIMMTKCAGIDTYIKTVVMRENADDLEALFQLSQRICVDVVPSYTILDTHRGVSGQTHRLSSVEAYQKVMEMAERYRPGSLGRGGRQADGAACGSGQCSLCVDPYGAVHPCLTMKNTLGNVRTDSLRAIWDNSAELERIRSIRFSELCTACGACAYVGCCDICMGRLGSERGVPEDVCMLSKAAYQVLNESTERRG